ncbi:MAG: hypothetical protein ACYC8T_05100 [Myxococcaceae bacterium]
MSAPQKSLRLAVLLLVGAGCSPPPPPPAPVRDPPQVFLTALESNVVGTAFKLTVNVNGCEKVKGLGVYDHDTFIKNIEFTASPTPFELSGADLGGQYGTWGLAISTLVTVKATCDDDRTNKSMPVSGTFFPVEAVWEDPTGQAVTDVFYAEGGLGGSKPSFVGCSGSATGTILLRRGFNVDTGQLETTGANLNLPFPCSINSEFSERNMATGWRWMWERGVGALAFDQNLNITSYVLGKVMALTVAPDGDAIIWIDGTNGKGIERVNPRPAVGVSNLRWGLNDFLPKGLVMGNPVIISNLNLIRVPVFQDDLGTSTGTVWIEDVDYSNGVKAAEHALKLINYGFMNTPEIPPAAFSKDGAIIYFPFTVGSTDGTVQSRVVACAANADACDGASGSLKWESPLLPGQTLANFLFSSGNQIAAIGARQMFSLSTANGQVTSFNNTAVIPDGSLTVMAAQVGLGTDFYLLNGPPGGYPIEVVSIDTPANGELYRYQMSGGSSPAAALTMSVDEAGTAWMRIGLKLVKPLALPQYRTVKGANKMEP